MKAYKTYHVAVVSAMLSGSGGGAPRSAAVQAGALSAAGLNVTIFTGHSRKYPLTPDDFPLNRSKIKSCRSFGPPALGINIGSFIELYRQAKQFDVIHVNMGWNLNTFIASRIARHHGIPYIYSLRSHMGAYHFKRYRFLKPILYWLFEKRNIRDAWGIHVTSDWETETSAPVISGKRIIKIPNAMDLADFKEPIPRKTAREHLGLSPNGLHVVCFGRLGTQKNPEFLFDAFRKAKLPADSHLHFVGPPEKQIKRKLLKAVDRHKMHANVHFVDFARGYDRRCWLACGDVFALPSHDENFCIAAIEAIASGTFALLSPHVGAIEYLPKNSLRVEPLDINKWCEALQSIGDKKPQQSVPKEDISALFSPTHIAKLWITAYQDLP